MSAELEQSVTPLGPQFAILPVERANARSEFKMQYSGRINLAAMKKQTG